MDFIDDNQPDGWYRQLSIEFPDGTHEVFHIQRRDTGTHIPLLHERPEPWTDLRFHKCPCCPLPAMILTCPAALSLQTTLSKLRERKSIDMVKATAIDSRGRSQTVEWPLQSVGSTLVQLAVFASSCPVGRRLKPYLEGLPPFVSSLDLSRRIGTMILHKHGGSLEASRQELAESLAPLHDVFTHLAGRLRGEDRDKGGGMSADGELGRDAVPNSITQVDAFAQLLSVRADKLFSQLSVELGWKPGGKPAARPAPSRHAPPRPAAPPPDPGGWWSRLLDLFR